MITGIDHLHIRTWFRFRDSWVPVEKNSIKCQCKQQPTN